MRNDTAKAADRVKKLEGMTPRPAYLDSIFCHDCREMTALPNESVHLVITSPPYNVTKTYDQNLTLQDYLSLLENTIKECARVLVSRGFIAINIANVGRKPYIPLDVYIIQLLLRHNFAIYQEIIWNKEASAGGSCAWGSWQSASNPSLRDIHEYIIVGVKDAKLEDVHVPVEDLRDLGDLGNNRDLGKFSHLVENKKININIEDYFTNIWAFQTESAKRVNHPAPFPVELPLRLIKMFSKVGDVVLDPFMGSGTVAIASILSGRHYVGYDISQEFIEGALKRINQFNAARAATTLDGYFKKRGK